MNRISGDKGIRPRLWTGSRFDVVNVQPRYGMTSMAMVCRCDWCAGAGKVTVPCPARHHCHDITLDCGRCKGTGMSLVGWVCGWCRAPSREPLPDELITCQHCGTHGVVPAL